MDQDNTKGSQATKKSLNKVWKWLGLLLICGGLVLLGFAGYEKLKIYRYQQSLKKEYEDTLTDPLGEAEVFDDVTVTELKPMRIVIPKINVDLIVQIGDVFDMILLDKGPVHFGMSDLPGTGPGNVAIAAHRGSRWGFFTDLDQLKAGDQLFLDAAGYRFIYETEWVKIVEPNDWSVIDTTDYPALTLQTCHPKNVRGTHRLILRGKLLSVTRATPTN